MPPAQGAERADHSLKLQSERKSKMKFDSKRLMSNRTARHATCRNQGWTIDLVRPEMGTLGRAESSGASPGHHGAYIGLFVMLVVDVHRHLPLSAIVTPGTAEDIAATVARLTERLGGPDEIWIDGSFELNRALRGWGEQHGTLITSRCS